MSLSVDLWTGIDKKKIQFNSTGRKLKTFSKLYKKFKENSNPEYLLYQTFQKEIELFENDSKNRKIFCINLCSLILEPINAYLEMPKTQLNKCYLENLENTEIFNKDLNCLIKRQDFFMEHAKN